MDADGLAPDDNVPQPNTKPEVAMELKEALEAFERALSVHAVPAVQHLAPPRPAAEVEAVLTDLGLPAHPDLITWWGWHDGVPFPSREEQGLITSAYWPLSLARAAEVWRETSGGDLDEGIDPPRELFPVAGWDNVVTLRVHVITGTVALDDPHRYTDPPFLPEWPSLSSWVTDAVALYESGAIRHTDDGFTVDLQRWPSTVRPQMHW